MTPDSWERIKQSFQAALERSPEERPDFLLEACRGDAKLQAEVEKLLQALDHAGDFLEKPAFGNLASGSWFPKPTVFSAGEVVSGRFEVIRFLGQGGMGEVYEARDLELGERLALKAIRRKSLRTNASSHVSSMRSNWLAVWPTTMSAGCLILAATCVLRVNLTEPLSRSTF